MSKRQSTLQAVKDNPKADLIVIGGGATGLGTAVEASLKGWNVVLLESHDFAGGTSSRSTKLLHGGVRYLAQGNVSLVREALSERRTVMNIAPHLAQPLAFVMPAYRWWEKLWYGLGLKVYDFLAGKLSLGNTRLLSKTDTIKALPGVKQTGLRGGVQYWDGQFDDARLGLALALTAEQNGARVLNYCEVTNLTPLDQGGYLVRFQDRLTGQAYAVEAGCVVNAAGVWVDSLRQKAAAGQQSAVKPGPARQTAGSNLAPAHMVKPSQGVHLVVDRRFMAGDKALLIPKTEDGRVLFAVPWLGALILGTTDTPRSDAPREPKPFEHEIEFILNEASKAFNQPVTRADVKSMWVGLRPLVDLSGQEGATQSISREHTILVEHNGLVTVTGGKWTTYRVMAEEVIEQALSAGLLSQPTKPDSSSASLALMGSPTVNSATVSVSEAPGIHLFGTQASAVAMMPGHNRELAMGLTESMVRYCAEFEHAVTVEDVLARRWRLLFLDAGLAASLAPEVAGILQDQTGMDPQLNDFLNLAAQYTLSA